MQSSTALPWEEGYHESWKTLPVVDFFTTQEYQDALSSNAVTNQNQELYIRIQLWWKYNDRIRDRYEHFDSKGNKLEGKTPIFINEAERTQWEMNCKLLIPLLEATIAKERMLIADLDGCKNDFDKCRKVARSVDHVEWNSQIENMLNETGRKDDLFYEKDDSKRWQQNRELLDFLLKNSELTHKAQIAELYRNLEYFDKCLETIHTV